MSMNDQNTLGRSAATEFSVGISSLLRNPGFVSIVLGLSIGVIVCFPLFGHGRLLLLDWISGPHNSSFQSSLMGLNGGLTTGSVLSLVTSALYSFFGSTVSWLLLLLFFPLATFAIGRLVGGSHWTRIAAGTLFVLNPFVFNRIYVGHIPLLLGYALLPLAIKTALKSPSENFCSWGKVTLWWFSMTALSPHFAWIYGLVIFSVFVVRAVKGVRPLARSLVWLCVEVASFAVSIIFMILPSFYTSLPSTIGTSSLNIYRTVADPIFGLYGNVISMYGFWRLGPGPTMPKNVLPGWFLVFIAILCVAAYHLISLKDFSDSSAVNREISNFRSAVSYIRSTDEQKQLTMVVLLFGLGGLFLSLGPQGATGPLFSFLYDHFSFFQIMRESQKFLMLWVLALALFFGWGATKVVVMFKKQTIQNVAGILLCIGLPIAYTPIMFNGLNGQISLSTVPSEFEQANKIMGDGPGKILYLPWHQYMLYPFTNGHVIANLGSNLFTRDVISGDNVEAGGVNSQSTSPRSSFIQSLLTSSPTVKHLGSLLEPLGVQFIVLSKNTNWLSYAWISQQPDLKLIADNSSLSIYENLSYVSKNEKNLYTGVVSNGHLITQLSPVSYKVSSGNSSWITTDIPYQKGWALNGVQVNASPQGLVQVAVGKSGGTLTFDPWKAVIIGYLISGIMVTTLGALVFVAHRNKISKGRRSKIT